MAARTARRLTGLAAAAIGIPLLWTAAAPAAPAGVTVRLGVTGMVTSAQPHGTWRLSAHSGDTLSFLAGSLPGLDHTDVDEVLNMRVSMDASHLSGGAHGKSLSTGSPYRVKLMKAGSYPIRWTVAFIVSHGRTTTVEATHDFAATVVVGHSTSGNSPGLVSPPRSPARTSSAAAPAARAQSSAISTTAAPAPTSAPSASPASVVPPTITLPPDNGSHPPPARASLPLSAPADTYLLTAMAGAFVLGLLWLLWVASIKPILGR